MPLPFLEAEYYNLNLILRQAFVGMLMVHLSSRGKAQLRVVHYC